MVLPMHKDNRKGRRRKRKRKNATKEAKKKDKKKKKKETGTKARVEAAGVRTDRREKKIINRAKKL